MPTHALSVDQLGMRLDALLVAEGVVESRRRARELCAAGLVKVNGVCARSGYILVSGDSIEFPENIPSLADKREHATIAKAPEVIYEDEFLLCLKKPRALFSVTHRVDDPLTFADMVAKFWPETITASPDPREAGLVQRLDYYTSGIVLVAKQLGIWQHLRTELFEGRVEKSYFALVEGTTQEATLSYYLRQSANGRLMEVTTAEDPSGMLTATTVRSSLPLLQGAASLVQAYSHRTRRHQIRVHLATAGNPLVGDSDYGAIGSTHPSPSAGNQWQEVEGFFLHATSISFTHPVLKTSLLLEDRTPEVQAYLDRVER